MNSECQGLSKMRDYNLGLLQNYRFKYRIRLVSGTHQRVVFVSSLHKEL